MQYFVLPTCCIAFNAKVASSALACSIVKKFYPDKLKKTLDDHDATWSKFSQEFKDSLPESFQKMFKTDYAESKNFWQTVCKRTFKPELPVLLAVREPITRFASTVAYLNLSVEQAINALENGNEVVVDKLPMALSKNTHFLPQSIYNTEGTKCYKFPEQLEQMCKDAGLDWPLPKINEGKNNKPILTPEQIERVKKFYAEDVKLYESL